MSWCCKSESDQSLTDNFTLHGVDGIFLVVINWWLDCLKGAQCLYSCSWFPLGTEGTVGPAGTHSLFNSVDGSLIWWIRGSQSWLCHLHHSLLVKAVTGLAQMQGEGKEGSSSKGGMSGNLQVSWTCHTHLPTNYLFIHSGSIESLQYTRCWTGW